MTPAPQPSKVAHAPASVIPIEEVVRQPLPGMAIPGQFAFSPDDELITYLLSPDESLVRCLYAFDPETGEQNLLVAPVDGGTTDENVSIEEALRRERQRQREIGVTEYAWAKRANRILTPMQGSIYVQENLASLAAPVSGALRGDSAEPSPRGRGSERLYFPMQREGNNE